MKREREREKETVMDFQTDTYIGRRRDRLSQTDRVRNTQRIRVRETRLKTDICVDRH